MSSAEQLGAILSLWEGTTVRDHMSIEEAVQVQYRLVDVAQQVMGSDEVSFLTYDQEHHRIAIADFGDIPDLDRSAAGFEHVVRPVWVACV